MGAGVLSRCKNGRVVTLTTQPHLAQSLKEEYSYSSTCPLGLHGLFQGELYLYIDTYNDVWLVKLARMITHSCRVPGRIYLALESTLGL